MMLTQLLPLIASLRMPLMALALCPQQHRPAALKLVAALFVLRMLLF